MKPSQIMRKAANEFLWDGRAKRRKGNAEYSCWAIALAEGGAQHFFDSPGAKIAIEAGASTNIIINAFWIGGGNFDKLSSQAARYMFLHMLALALEEEGQ